MAGPGETKREAAAVLCTDADDECAKQRVDADRVHDEASSEHDAHSCADERLFTGWPAGAMRTM